MENYSFDVNNLFGKNFKFHSNLNFPKNTLSYLPSFYKNILKLWSKYYSNELFLPSIIVSQYLWFNSSIRIDKKINFVNDLIKGNGKLETWEQITREFKIDKNLYFKFVLQYQTTGKRHLQKIQQTAKIYLI